VARAPGHKTAGFQANREIVLGPLLLVQEVADEFDVLLLAGGQKG